MENKSFKAKRLLYSIVFLLLAILSCSSAMSQKIDSSAVNLNRAINLLNGTNGRFDHEKAIHTIKYHANAGEPMAMNAIGICYMKGLGVVNDTIKGINWLQLAAGNGYNQAWHNLGLVYKYSWSGVKQNMKTAFDYFNEGAKQEDKYCLYDAGYMLYKGFGCDQNYEKAFEYFSKASKVNYSPAMYMLGLCYRNGYGTPRSAGDANYWLSQAMLKGYREAADELNADEAENPQTRMSVRNNQASPGNISSFYKIKHLVNLKSEPIDGKYEGVLVTYDWSGKNALKVVPLLLEIKSDGEYLKAQWNEQGNDSMQVEAVWKDTCLQFTKATQNRTDHYSFGKSTKWNFSNARLQMLKDSTSSYLAGDIQMISPETLEPNRPMYMSLRKLNQQKGNNNNSDIDFKVYPNPFYEGINIDFYQLTKSDVIISFYNMEGKCLLTNNIGKYDKGMQQIAFKANLAPGTYLLKLSTEGKNFQSIVIRK